MPHDPSRARSLVQTNPYEGHPNLSELEAEVLWQYAKLSQNIKEVRPSPPSPCVERQSDVSIM